jgi:hypothetical protein
VPIIDSGDPVSTTQLVTLDIVKDYLNIRAADTVHDIKLGRFIDAITPLIENVTGPMIPRVFDEWHDGGQVSIRLRHRPATGFGTTPILDLVGVEEYRGPTKYTLAIVTDPSHGTIYSCMADTYGRVIRRSAGGGTIAFPAGQQTVHVVYRAGQVTVPANVQEGALELIRVNYQQTQATGRGRQGMADTLEGPGVPMGFFMPRRVLELLSPQRRAPSIA